MNNENMKAIAIATSVLMRLDGQTKKLEEVLAYVCNFYPIGHIDISGTDWDNLVIMSKDVTNNYSIELVRQYKKEV